MLSKQEIFDKVAKHLLTQMRRSTGKRIIDCMYRSPDGLKCGIGALIPDELYDPRMETSKVCPDHDGRRSITPFGLHHTIAMQVGKASGYLPKGTPTKEYSEFLNSLQRVHDHTEPNDWKERLIQFAEEEGLIFNGS